MSTITKPAVTIDHIKQLIPPLAEHKYKGQAGKIAIIGGCREYTGAPFFASYSALKVGADLSHVFCSPSAATVIKTYSPELIVHPYLPETTSFLDNLTNNSNNPPTDKTLTLSHEYNDATLHQWRDVINPSADAVSAWLDRFDTLVIGPGLGRDGVMLHTVEFILKKAIQKNIPLVIDADGLWLINKRIELIQGYRNAILTPNIAEFKRLASALNITVQSDDEWYADEVLAEIVTRLQGPTVVRKGNIDCICSSSSSSSSSSKSDNNKNNGDGGVVMVSCNEEGSLRRAGGQGDVLSGTIATFFSWGMSMQSSSSSLLNKRDNDSIPIAVLAAYGGCFTTRRASRYAFAKHGRAMGASDVMSELGRTIDQDLS